MRDLSSKRRLLCELLLFGLFCAVFFFGCSQVQTAQDGYTYYGFIPSAIPDYGFLWVTGNYDNTHCRLYELPAKRLLEGFTVSRLELKSFNLPNGSLFKLVSDKHVTVFIKGRAKLGDYNSDSTTNYPSVDGTYIGKEFIFPVSKGTLEFTPYRIFSMEDTTVKITDAGGSLLTETKLQANGFLGFHPKNGTVYRVQSTGYIEVVSFNFQESYFVPAATGGFVGTVFYGSGDRTHGGEGEERRYRVTYISSIEGAKVRVFDLGTSKWAKELEVPPKSSVTLYTKDFTDATFETAAYVLLADKPVTIQSLSNYTGELRSDGRLYTEGGVSMIGLRPNEKTMFFVPGREAYAFASEDCILTLNDLDFRLATDEHMPLEHGTYEAAATRRVIIQIVDFDPSMDVDVNGPVTLTGFAEALPAVETFALSPADLVLKPPTEESNLTYYMTGGAAVVVAGAAGGILYKRRSRKLP